MNIRHKIQIFLMSALIVTLIGFSFSNPSITGHVSANINRQGLNLVISKSENFLLTSDNLEPFTITSFKLSGNITGNGQVKVYIDTGKGQRLLVYDNIAKRRDEGGGLSMITSKVVEDTGMIDDAEGENIGENDEWLVIKPIKVLLEKEVFDELVDGAYLVSGAFNGQCRETCIINMDVSRDIAYRLVFLVENGTILKLSEVIFNILE